MEERKESNQTKNKNGGLKTKTQKLKAKLLKSYYGNPMKDMKLIAITGTTGKTTVAHYVHEILRASGEQVAVLEWGRVEESVQPRLRKVLQKEPDGLGCPGCLGGPGCLGCPGTPGGPGPPGSPAPLA